MPKLMGLSMKEKRRRRRKKRNYPMLTTTSSLLSPCTLSKGLLIDVTRVLLVPRSVTYGDLVDGQRPNLPCISEEAMEVELKK